MNEKSVGLALRKKYLAEVKVGKKNVEIRTPIHMPNRLKMFKSNKLIQMKKNNGFCSFALTVSVRLN